MARWLHRAALAGLYLAGLGTVAYFAWSGWDYYRTPLIERPRHELYWTLKPGGSLGRAFGIAGAAMMVLMLGYSLRKRWQPLRRLGPVRMWLDYHIFLGICGPLLIVLHSSFKVKGLVALSFWSMVAVALSGVLGRYLYRQIPRTVAGDELSLEEVEKLDQELSRQLVESFGLPPEAIVELEATAEAGLDSRRALPVLWVQSAIASVRVRRQLRRLRQSYHNPEPGLQRQFERTVAHKAALRRRLVLLSKVRRLFHHWHVIHKPFAVIMYLFMLVHIAVAWMTGYA